MDGFSRRTMWGRATSIERKCVMRWILLLGLLVTGSARAAGLLAPDDQTLPPLRVTDHLVDVKIHDRVALTTVTQTFHNDTGRRLEATYIFPLPEHADLTDFRMSFNGKFVEGEVLPADEARRIYESIVVDGSNGATIQMSPTGTDVSITVARAIAPAALTPPAPCANQCWSKPRSSCVRNAVYWRIILTAFGVSGGAAAGAQYERCQPITSSVVTHDVARTVCAVRFASRTSAATPVVTAVAMLAPLSLRKRTPFSFTCSEGYFLMSVLFLPAAFETSAWPGATRSGFANPSYQVGPREL